MFFGVPLCFQILPRDEDITDEFLFDEVSPANGSRKFRIYKYKVNNNTKCLGLKNNCADATLSLIPANGSDRRCYFKRAC